jgi:cation transport protein ChaC
MGRGSSEAPGLMLTLERGDGACTGLAFRIEANRAEAESTILWRREMLRGGYVPTLVPVSTPQGAVSALVFACNHAHPDYVGELPLPEAGRMIARGCGVLGTNRQYIEDLALQLAHLGIEDAYLTELLTHVRECAPA